jgi:DDE superfamily endonuclease
MINHLENLRKYIRKIIWKRLILIWDYDSFHLSMTVRKHINTQKDWLTIIHLPKKAPYLNPNERKVNEKINQMYVLIFYEHIED